MGAAGVGPSFAIFFALRNRKLCPALLRRDCFHVYTYLLHCLLAVNRLNSCAVICAGPVKHLVYFDRLCYARHLCSVGLLSCGWNQWLLSQCCAQSCSIIVSKENTSLCDASRPSCIQSEYTHSFSSSSSVASTSKFFRPFSSSFLL